MIKKSFRIFFTQNTQLIILILLIAVFSIIVPQFATYKNLMNILKQTLVISLACSGLALVILSGNLDLSIGSLYTFTLVLSVGMQRSNNVLAVLVPIVAALIVGLINGYIVTSFNVNSIIVTLGMYAVLAGLIMAYTKGNVIVGNYGTSYSLLAEFRIFHIQFYIFFYIIIAIIYQIILKTTKFGRSIIYIGINQEAARIVGINYKRVVTLTFMICSLSIAMAAIFMGSRQLQANTIAGVGLEFEALTAVLIGGVSLRGGKGSIYNAMIGVFLLAVIMNALTLFGVAFEWRNIASGILILLALGVDSFLRGKYAV